MPVAATQGQAPAKLDRQILFLSHATPEDNEFARWLASQLVIAGYQVWCDVTDLLGGERFWSDIEEAIACASFRFLFVSTIHGNTKPGTLRELKLAQQAQIDHDLKDFIVPLKVDQFPFGSMQPSIQDLNMIRFDETWAAGLRQLLALLEREGAPKSSSAGADAVMDWYSRSMDCTRQVVRSNDKYLSNWFALQLPPQVYGHKFRGPSASLPSVATGFPYPYRVVGSHLVTFAPGWKVVDSLGPGWAEDDVVICDTDAFISDGSELLGIATFDAANVVSDLIRQSWEAEMHVRQLSSFELASGILAWFFKNQQLEKNKAHFTVAGRRKTYRQLVGLKSKNTIDGGKMPDGFWHYAVSASPQLHPFPRLVLRHHVVFTDDGQTPWLKADRMHKARRSVCKQWWNREWRDRLLAFCAQFEDDQKGLALPTGGENIVAEMRPIGFTSPWTYYEDGEVGLDESAEIELIEDADEAGEADDDA